VPSAIEYADFFENRAPEYWCDDWLSCRRIVIPRKAATDMSEAALN
jgi:hypothetical protein